MAGKQIKGKSATVTAQSATGYATIADVTGWYKSAFGTLYKDDYASVEIQVTEIKGSTLGLRRVRDPGEGVNYGRDNFSANYNPEVRLSFTAQTSPFTVGKTVTGGTSAAHGVISKIVLKTVNSGYLVITTITGTFQAAETITDNNLVQGSATASGAQATTNATVTQRAQFIYNSNDKPLT